MDEPIYLRWDAAPRSVLEEERSLDGGLRYSLEGGSYEAFRDQLDWGANVPSATEFESAIDAAFDAWTVTDPATGLGTSLYFVPDLATEVYDHFGDPNNIGSFLGVNWGAEIDLIVDTTHYNPFYLASVIFFVDVPSFHDITLTSGTTDYAGFAISGADIRFNPAYFWSIDMFRIVLTHEIGHALGFGDAEVFPDALGLFSAFLDDDYDGTDSASALATLTNSFALMIDPFDPDSTPLVHVPGNLNSDPGLDTPGVDILMESEGNPGLAIANPVLQNDDFAGRQFLYPVPEPAAALLLALAAAALLAPTASRSRTDAALLLALAGLALYGSPAYAFRIIDAGPALTSPNPVYVRWDAAPRSVVEEERSLDGGLRYSLEGGSYAAFRDQLSWTQVPTVESFEAAVESAFAFWTEVDPASGLGTSLYFVEDFATEVFDDPGQPGNPASWIGVNYGAEIDIIAETPTIQAIASAIAFVDLASFHDITLSSGTTDYAGFAISGADIRIDPNTTWDLALFQTVLAHEIGHAIGFADFPQYPGVGGAFSPFLDDNYDGSSSATALATLTNSFALGIDPYDPDGTPLLLIADALAGDPGLASFGVEMLMEQLYVGSMSNNEFAGRQFLYPYVVPEPGAALLLGAAALLAALRLGA